MERDVIAYLSSKLEFLAYLEVQFQLVDTLHSGEAEKFIAMVSYPWWYLDCNPKDYGDRSLNIFYIGDRR